ncbi:hypothetical protein IGI80_001248 [Enterococcus sp. DIV1420a]
MSNLLNNRLSVLMILLCITASICIWLKYLFFYNPYHGSFDLLRVILISLVGIIPSLYIKSIGLRLLLIIVNVF